ncbi:MAG: transposase [Deltaproteobacteria bacterium]|nr:MAG: transposase [Deltaproteobacteria bacterium]
MLRVYRFRLYPTPAQRRAMNRSLEACRWVYNKVLEVRKRAWEEGGESLSRFETIKMLPGWKQEQPSLNDAYSQVLQEVCTRVDLVFQAFLRRVKGGENPVYPRFKGEGGYRSFVYPQSGFKVSEDGKRLYLSKIGHVKIRLHRPLEGQVKRLRVWCDLLGRWYAAFVCDVEPRRLPSTIGIVGVALGSSHFATLSNGECIDTPPFFRRDARDLAKAECRLSRLEKGTSQYRRQERVVRHIRKRMFDRRTDFVHKLSRDLVEGFQIIVFGKLGMEGGERRDPLWRISDAAWSQLVHFTTYKAESAGRCVVVADPHDTAQECSRCHTGVSRDFCGPIHACPWCGLEIDRDLNAAINILARGLAHIASKS